MLNYDLELDDYGHVQHVNCHLYGRALLHDCILNKGSAFTPKERSDFRLSACLPQRVETLEEQAERMYKQYNEQSTDLQKNIFLTNLHDTNEVLFYYLVAQKLEEMLPIIYTPTVGEAVQKFSLELRKPRGLCISYEQKDHIKEILKQRRNEHIDLIVTTDGEGVLGIGDQGIGGIDISIAKLMVYTLAGGVNPNRVMPVQLDVGTNNERLLSDPMYLGWRHERITGDQYDEFIDAYVKAVFETFPQVFQHWEDFGRGNARRILDRYRDTHCSFNDDMQGTAMVALATIMGALTVTKKSITQQKIVMFGAGTAGAGIVDQICDAMVDTGMDRAAARKCFWLIDRDGLVINDQDIPDFQQPYARSRDELSDWVGNDKNQYDLEQVVSEVKPTVLIGCSTVAGAFNEKITKVLADAHEHPIIMPLSNPTSHCEAKPQDLYDWTDGRVLMSTGSPFPPVTHNGETHRVAQGNNAFIFPGLGLGVIASQAKIITKKMIVTASHALSECCPVQRNPKSPLLPRFEDVLDVSMAVAKAVAHMACEEGVARVDDNINLDQQVERLVWRPEYYEYRYVPK